MREDKNTKQDRQVELLFTEGRCNYFNKSVQHQKSVNSSDTQVKSKLIPRLCTLMENECLSSMCVFLIFPSKNNISRKYFSNQCVINSNNFADPQL